MLFSLGCLFLIAILNVALFLYLTNKSKIANDIAESADKMGVEIVVLQGKIHKAESIARISNDAKISGLSRNTSVKVLSVAEDNIGLR